MSPKFLPKLVTLCFFLFILLDNIEGGKEEYNGLLNGTKTRSKTTFRDVVRKVMNVKRVVTNLLKPKGEAKGSYLSLGKTLNKKTSLMDREFYVDKSIVKTEPTKEKHWITTYSKKVGK